MSIFGKIITAVKGGAREAGEAIVDANGIRIFEQEIHEAKAQIGKAKQNLTKVMAEKMKCDRQITQLSDESKKYEEHALAALNKGNEALAIEVSEKIAGLEHELSIQTNARTTFATQIDQLKAMIRKAEEKIRSHERELAMIKTTENVQRATQSISNDYSGGLSKMVNARGSLERIKAKQQARADQMKAQDELNDDMGNSSLDAKLKAAGIGETNSAASDVLSKLRAKAGK